jgi:ADP-heptose:LPS heptosyltransferase
MVLSRPYLVQYEIANCAKDKFMNLFSREIFLNDQIIRTSRRTIKRIWFFGGHNLIQLILAILRPFRSIPETDNVVILRMDGIGDSVIFSGALKYIREAYPESKITIIIRGYVRSLYKNCPYVDKIIEWDNNSFLWNPRYRLRFLWSISSAKAQVVLCPHWTKFEEVAEVLRTIESDEVVAFETFSDSKIKGRITTFVSIPKTVYREIDRYVFFLRKIIPTLTSTSILKTEIWMDTKDSAIVEEKYPHFQNTKYVTIIPGAGGAIKQWSVEKWILLLLKLQSQYTDYEFVLLGGKEDAPLCEQIVEKVNKNNVRNLCSCLQLNELAIIIKNSCLCIGVDTGAIHISAACEIPTICIMGGGHFGRFYPYGDLKHNIVVNKPMDCYGCDWKCIHSTVRCIQEIEIDRVYSKIAQNLGKGQ